MLSYNPGISNNFLGACEKSPGNWYQDIGGIYLARLEITMSNHQASISDKWALAGHVFSIVGTTCFTIAGLLKLLREGRLPAEPTTFTSRSRHSQELAAADYFDRDRRHP